MADIQEKINQMQIVQQNTQNLAMQRQQFQIQQTEIESALGEIEKSTKSYKIIGNVMVQVENSDLKKDLDEKKQMLTIRIGSIEKQEEKLREKAEDLQKEILKQLEEKKDDKDRHK